MKSTLFPQGFNGPLSSGANAYKPPTRKQFITRCEKLFGEHWQQHISHLSGSNRSTVLRYVHTEAHKRVEVPRKIMLIVALFEKLVESGGDLPLEYFDYETRDAGRPVKAASA